MKKLHPRAKKLFLFRKFIAAFLVSTVFVLFIISLFWIESLRGNKEIYNIAIFTIIILFLTFNIIYAFFSYLLTKKFYNNYNYELTEKEVKVEFLYRNKKSTVVIPYTDVRHFYLSRGVTNHIFGLSSIYINGITKQIKRPYIFPAAHFLAFLTGALPAMIAIGRLEEYNKDKISIKIDGISIDEAKIIMDQLKLHFVDPTAAKSSGAKM